MAVIKASNFKDFQEQLNYLYKLERETLEKLECRRLNIKTKEIQKITLQELRKRQPDYLLPPIEVKVSSLEEPHLDYHCPYCNVVLKDTGDRFYCNVCDKKWSKKSVFNTE